MVLRLFSRSNPKTEDKTATSGSPEGTTLPGEDATVEELVSAAKSATSSKHKATLIGRINDIGALQTLASLEGCLAPCADKLAEVEDVAAALKLATTAQRRQELALGAHNSTLREAQLLAITDESELIELEHASRSRNKACNRTARARLDRLRSARNRASEAAATANELAKSAAILVNKAEAISTDARAGAASPSALVPKEEHVLARFNALADKHKAAADQWADSEKTLAEFAESAPTLSPMPLPPAEQASQPADEGPDFKAIAQRFTALREQLESGTSASALALELHSAGDEWRDAISQSTPDAKSIDQVTTSTNLFEKVSACEALLAERAEAIAAINNHEFDLTPEQLTSLGRKELPAAWKQVSNADAASKAIRKITKGLTYPSQIPVPEVLTQLLQHTERASALLTAAKSRQSELENSFQTQVKRLSEALDAGELKKAEAARGEARSLQEALPGGAAQTTRKRFGTLLASMQNLRDWQHFATDPKREELCKQMTDLADNPAAPTEQADQVKALRAQWNALGGKGPKDIAERFDAAAARAFEPCRAHYAELAEQRSANLATRKSILAQLETFVSETDWTSTDLNAARAILNSARTEWRDAFPVERGANRALEKQFKAVTDNLYAKLQDRWSDNLAEKEKLVATAEALVSSEDPLPERLEKAKGLQQQWKNAGPVPRGPDQKLWRRFRAACDTLFNTRDEERNQAQAEYAAQQTAAKARLAEFAALLEATAPADLERSALNAMKSDLDAIDNLDRSVLKEARALEDQFNAKLKTKAAAKKQETLTALQALDVLAASTESAGGELPAEVLAGDKVFAARTAPAENAHLDLVLEAETQAGIESPASDAQRRLELQVQWLNAGMNSGARTESDALQLARRWCGLTATSESNALRERLFVAAQALL